uniref:Protein arginine methyltransferase NDUFAF7 n=1 Tax=Chenopodium quinoa TaxID=63459 RepID=A0A803MNR7_CHEQI
MYRSVCGVYRILPRSPELKWRISGAYFSTHVDVNQPLLVRDFIHAALYDPEHGYFSKRSASVGVLDSSINFNQLQGRKAYLQHLNKVYKQSEVSWFTPVELFKPWYAHGIAEAILRTANLSVPLKIYEIGGGSGTCAKGIMDYLISVEISPSLAEKQKETVGQVQSHKSRFTVECRDAADRNGWGNVQEEPCWVIMLEVLDNLPHDLIYAKNQGSPWEEVWVEKQLDSCLKLIEALHSALPKMSLIASDFSYLPDVRIPGVRAPLVSAKIDGCSIDYDSYLDAKGDADIFFPTDFWLLERFDHYCSGWLETSQKNPLKEKKRRRTITSE